MKKKVFSVLTVIMVAGSLMSSAPYEKTIEEDGNATKCAKQTREYVLELAKNNGHDANSPEHFEFYIGIYHDVYSSCYGTPAITNSDD